MRPLDFSGAPRPWRLSCEVQEHLLGTCFGGVKIWGRSVHEGLSSSDGAPGLGKRAGSPVPVPGANVPAVRDVDRNR